MYGKERGSAKMEWRATYIKRAGGEGRVLTIGLSGNGGGGGAAGRR